MKLIKTEHELVDFMESLLVQGFDSQIHLNSDELITLVIRKLPIPTRKPKRRSKPIKTNRGIFNGC